MITYIDSQKTQYKANLHCHTTLSDGRATPEEVKREYKARGYSVVAYTDHEHIVDNSHLSDGDFIALTGCELGVNGCDVWDAENKQNAPTVHISIFALDPHNVTTPFADRKSDNFGPEQVRDAATYDGRRDLRRFGPEGINALVEHAHAQGFLVSLNHPTWSLICSRDYLDYEGFDFLEIYNTGCVRAGLAPDETSFSVMLKHGKRIFCTAADDNHNSHGFTNPHSDSFGGFVMISADKLEYSEVMNALKNGDFYASSGPEIYSLTREGNTVTVKCSPAVSVTMQTGGRSAVAVFPENGETICEATFKLREVYGVFRITVRDASGEYAYTQAYDV